MRLKQIVVVILGIVILVVSQISVAWSQANLSLLEHGSNNQCYAEAKAFSMDWGNGIFDEDSEDSTDKNRANALALVDGAFAITTSRAYGGANKYDVEALRVGLLVMVMHLLVVGWLDLMEQRENDQDSD